MVVPIIMIKEKNNSRSNLKFEPESQGTILFCFGIAALITFLILAIMRKFSSKMLVDEISNASVLLSNDGGAINTVLTQASEITNQVAGQPMVATGCLLNDSLKNNNAEVSKYFSGGSAGNIVSSNSDDELRNITLSYAFLTFCKMFILSR